MSNQKEEQRQSVQSGEKHAVVLAIDPTVRGFGYVVFEGPQMPIDWGLINARIDKNRRILKRIEQMLEFYEPDVVVLENCDTGMHQRSERAQKLLARIQTLARKKQTSVVGYTREQVLAAFSTEGVQTKYAIAQKISTWLPELASRLPPKRKPWMCEDERFGIFDAAALGITYYYQEE